MLSATAYVSRYGHCVRVLTGKPRWDRLEAYSWNPLLPRPGFRHISLDEYKERASEFDAVYEWIADEKQRLRIVRSLQDLIGQD